MNLHIQPLLLALLIITTVMLPFRAMAATPSLSPATYESLNSIQAALGESRFDDARSQLDELIADLKPGFGMALAYELYGQLFLLQDNNREGLRWYQKSLAEDALTPAMEAGMATSVAQLLLAEDDFQAAIDALAPRLSKLSAEEARQQQAKKETASAIIQPLAYATLGSAYHLVKDYQQSTKAFEEALRRATSKGENPRENWLQMLMSGYYQLGDYQATARVLADLIRINPGKEDYWVQRASMFQLLNKQTEALSSLETGYAAGYVSKTSNILLLSQLLISQGIPERAARILEQHLAQPESESREEDWRLLGMAWQQGRERLAAIEAINKAAEFSDDGKLPLFAARLAYQDNNVQLVLSQIDLALSKGLEADQKAQALMLAGSSALQLDDKPAARRYFQQALKHPHTAANARSWLNYIDALDQYGG